LFEKDLAFRDKNHTGKQKAIEIIEIENKYVLPESKYSIKAGMINTSDKKNIKMGKRRNVGLRLIIQTEISL